MNDHTFHGDMPCPLQGLPFPLHAGSKDSGSRGGTVTGRERRHATGAILSGGSREMLAMVVTYEAAVFLPVQLHI